MLELRLVGDDRRFVLEYQSDIEAENQYQILALQLVGINGLTGQFLYRDIILVNQVSFATAPLSRHPFVPYKSSTGMRA
jgi:hypothetical protein